ncbi:DUF3575 domain-containing protein [Bacteroides reticulotermitis]
MRPPEGSSATAAGLSYGYSLPVGGRLGVEFGIAAGYLSGTYHVYDYCMDHRLWSWLQNPEAELLRRYPHRRLAGLAVKRRKHGMKDGALVWLPLIWIMTLFNCKSLVNPVNA